MNPLALLPADGIGPEAIAEAIACLDLLSRGPDPLGERRDGPGPRTKDPLRSLHEELGRLVNLGPDGVLGGLHCSDAEVTPVKAPAGAIAAAAIMLDELGLSDSARLLSDALEAALRERCCTGDLGETVTCRQFGERVRRHLEIGLERLSAFRQLIAMNRGCCG